MPIISFSSIEYNLYEGRTLSALLSLYSQVLAQDIDK